MTRLPRTMKRAAFLDRDGVINRKAPEGEFITRRSDFEILPGVPQAIRSLNRAGFVVVVVTNQRCVAKGLLSASALRGIHEFMVTTLKEHGAVIDAIYCCPHGDASPCDCRKPKPGMLLEAAEDHGIDLRASWMIGDAAADVGAGKAAGCRTIRLANGKSGPASEVAADFSAPSLSQAISIVLRGQPWRRLRNQEDLQS